ncbi:gastrokine-1-like [Nyctibius grandis]|uniref:gastrokine-1-like n=1 Tax=Nyctibius grandis TaxID=48427 RepID=UPI0035BC6928
MVHTIQSACTSISSAVKMKVAIVTTVLLGLFLAPALALEFQNINGNPQFVNNQGIRRQFTINGGYQVLFLNPQWRVATIEEVSPRGSWKTIWNYARGFIASKVLPEGVCFISVMNRGVMPAFDALPRLAEEIRAMGGQGQPARVITFDVRRPVQDLQAYGPEIATLCRGFTTYLTYEVYGPQFTFNPGSCLRLDVLQLVNLKYCRGNNLGFNNININNKI